MPTRLLFALVLAVFMPGCASIVATSGRVVLQDEPTHVDVSFSSRDRTLIDEYYRERRRNLPPGLAKRHGDLPPGLRKHDRLPPDLRREPLPYELERRLTRLPSGYVRAQVGHDVVLFDSRTRVVVDVVYGVAF